MSTLHAVQLGGGVVHEDRSGSPYFFFLNGQDSQWRTQEFFFVEGGSTNSVEGRENRDLGTVAP
jgi:hypothetical protein